MRRPPKLRTGDAQGSKTHSDAVWNLEINFLGCCEGLDRLGMHPHAWAFCPASCQDLTLLPEKNHVLQEFQIFLKRFIFVVGVSFLLHCSVYRYLFGCRFSPRSPAPPLQTLVSLRKSSKWLLPLQRCSRLPQQGI